VKTQLRKMVQRVLIFALVIGILTILLVMPKDKYWRAMDFGSDAICHISEGFGGILNSIAVIFNSYLFICQMWKEGDAKSTKALLCVILVIGILYLIAASPAFFKELLQYSFDFGKDVIRHVIVMVSKGFLIPYHVKVILMLIPTLSTVKAGSLPSAVLNLADRKMPETTVLDVLIPPALIAVIVVVIILVVALIVGLLVYYVRKYRSGQYQLPIEGDATLCCV